VGSEQPNAQVSHNTIRMANSTPPAMGSAQPVARLDAANDRLQALVQAAKTVRPRLAAFYASLGDEQKAQFNNLGQQSSTRSENAPGNR
jgi:hypothetical protein